MLNPGIFDGVRVIELAQYVFVPASGSLLADFGAEVIKVEVAGFGDPYRTLSVGDGREMAEVNIALEQNNRNKKSIGIDLKSEEGRDVLRRLIETADVFSTSLRPKALKRLGLDVKDVRAWNPSIIYARGNGYGFRGPDADRPGFDATAFWTRGGFADVLRHMDHNHPVRPRPAFGDHSGAMAMAFGIAAALFRRERTGVANVVEGSLLATGMWILSQDISASQTPTYDGSLLERRALKHPLFQAFRTSDNRWIQFMLLNPDRYWAAFCGAIGLEKYADDPRFRQVDARAENGEECTRLIREAIGSQTWDELRPNLEKFDGPWELSQTIQELLVDPQACANGYVVDTQMSNGEHYKLVAGPITFDGFVPESYSRAPKLGEHTDELLFALGLAPDAVADLRARAVIT